MSSRKNKSHDSQPYVLISGEVLRQIRQHARSSSKTEVCGVLIGKDNGNGANEINVVACIAGLNATQAGTHVTFTQDTWEHIYKIKDADFPDERIVGWYHSHPGFGVFLSDHDTFIHKNFFSSPSQVAWVYDPHSDEEGCFGWIGSRLERLSEISVEDGKGGEKAGETGKPEPMVMGDSDGDSLEVEQRENASKKETPPWLRNLVLVLTHLVLFGGGFLLAWYTGPRVLLVPVDPQSGRALGPPIDIRELEAAAKARAQQENGPNAAPAPASPSAIVPDQNPGQGNNNATGQAGSGNSATRKPAEKQSEKTPGQTKDPHAP